MAPRGDDDTGDGEGGIAFGDYRLIRRLGAGGMAEVFLARRAGDRLGRLVAVKRILPELAAQQDTMDALLDEARVVAHLDHPQIVSIQDVGEVDGMVFLAMEYVHGVSLQLALSRWASWELGGFPWPIACRIAACVCEALEYAHALVDPTGQRLGVVHRDVNPSNIMLGFNGVVKLTDFGIALSSVKEGVTRPGVVMAKLEYAAPEQFRGEPLDARTDVYGLGMTLFQMLTGRLPFDGVSQPQAIRAILERDPPPLSRLRRDVPPALGLLVDRALAKVPDARFQSAAEVRTRLESLFINARLKVGMLELSGFLAGLAGMPHAESPVPSTTLGDPEMTEGSTTGGVDVHPTERNAALPGPTAPLADAANDQTLVERLMEQARRRLDRSR